MWPNQANGVLIMLISFAWGLASTTAQLILVSLARLCCPSQVLWRIKGRMMNDNGIEHRPTDNMKRTTCKSTQNMTNA